MSCNGHYKETDMTSIKDLEFLKEGWVSFGTTETLCDNEFDKIGNKIELPS